MESEKERKKQARKVFLKELQAREMPRFYFTTFVYAVAVSVLTTTEHSFNTGIPDFFFSAFYVILTALNFYVNRRLWIGYYRISRNR